MIEVQFAGVPDVTEIVELLLLAYSPQLPELALSLVRVPARPAVVDGVMAPVACKVVNFPVLAVVLPMAPGDANVAPPSVAALTVVLHAKPVPLAQFSALALVLQLGTAVAVGAADAPVGFPSTVLAATGDNEPVLTLPHAGAVLDPVETIA